MIRAVAAATLLFLAATASAEPPPDDDSDRDAEIFGPADEEDPPPDPAPVAEPPDEEDDSDAELPPDRLPDDRRDEAIFGEPEERAFPEDDGGPPITDAAVDALDDPLQIGGFIYLRPTFSITDSNDIEDHRFSMPNLVEVYLDTRPTDRLRGYVRGRLRYDPTVDEDEPAFGLGPIQQEQLVVALDELWLNFDVARVMYVTIGQTHIRWGATRIWNPVDVINRNRRDPLNPFDERTGIPVVKLHFPVEALGWNFYLLGLMDRVDSLDKAGVAARAELVAKTAEIGLTTAYRDGIDPKIGVDLSAGVWDFELTSELGLTFTDRGPRVQVTGGLQYPITYGDDDYLMLGVEYFFNQFGNDSVEDAIFAAAGVDDAAGLFSPGMGSDPVGDQADLFGGLEFFYIARHYGAFFLLLPGPGTWDDTTFTFSTIGNLSDRSFVSRLDVSMRVLTYLSLQLFAQVSYGQQGELNLGPEVFSGVNELLDPLGQSITFPRQIAQVGLWLRLDL